MIISFNVIIMQIFNFLVPIPIFESISLVP